MPLLSLNTESLEKDIYFLKLAFKEALNSPDPSTQCGAILLSSSDIVMACNDFPVGIEKTTDRLNDRNIKYDYIEHAERNVIFKAIREGKNFQDFNVMYACWYPCVNCARAIIQSGIKRIVAHQEMMNNCPERWRQSLAVGYTMLKEAGVKTDLIDEKLNCKPIRFNGSIFYP